LASLYGVPATHVLGTRGADEAIDVLSRIYLRAGTDAILQCAPTFGMYQVAARIQGADVIETAAESRSGLEHRCDAGPGHMAPQHQAGVPVLAEQSHRESPGQGGARAHLHGARRQGDCGDR